MDRIRRAAVVMRLIERLRERGSWCGETHVQKAVLFLQEMAEVPLGFDYILYKHGPFSFDLRDELTSLRADGLLRLEPQPPYGPQILPTDQSKYVQNLSSRTLGRYDPAIAFVANTLGARGVMDLERLATAFFVTKRPEGDVTVEGRAQRLRELKPHISREAAISAVHEVDSLLKAMPGATYT